MNKTETLAKAPKKQWDTPELVDLDMDMQNVESAFAAGVDALMFGLMTSMS